MVASDNDEAAAAAAPASPTGSGSEAELSVGIVATAPVDDEAFETLAAEIKEVLAELAQDKAMDAFRGEYEKLFAALEKSHANEKRLDTKCDELASEIANQQGGNSIARNWLEVGLKSLFSFLVTIYCQKRTFFTAVSSPDSSGQKICLKILLRYIDMRQFH